MNQPNKAISTMAWHDTTVILRSVVHVSVNFSHTSQNNQSERLPACFKKENLNGGKAITWTKTWLNVFDEWWVQRREAKKYWRLIWTVFLRSIKVRICPIWKYRSVWKPCPKEGHISLWNFEGSISPSWVNKIPVLSVEVYLVLICRETGNIKPM